MHLVLLRLLGLCLTVDYRFSHYKSHIPGCNAMNKRKIDAAPSRDTDACAVLLAAQALALFFSELESAVHHLVLKVLLNAFFQGLLI